MSTDSSMASATTTEADAFDRVDPLLPIFVLAFVLFAIRLIAALHYPFFEGDPGQRMLMAHLPIAAVGNRIWLPLLQIHIWTFYLFHLPYYVFNTIPCFYFFVAVLFLGLLAYRNSSKDYSDRIFSLLLMFCFAYQSEVQFLSTRLYQESLAFAGLYVLLWAGALELKQGRWLVPIGAAALLTRECFWIYLLALCLVNWKKIVGDKKTAAVFAALWSIPVLWLLATFWVRHRSGGRLPSLAVQWPLGINKEGSLAISNVVMSLASFSKSLLTSKAIFLVAALVTVWVMGKIKRPINLPGVKRDLFDLRFRQFSLLSLAIIYSLVILFNPWEATFANPRMAAPLLAHAFVWAALLFDDTHYYTARLRIMSRVVLIAGLILSLNLDVRSWISHGDLLAERSVADIAELVKVTGKDHPAKVCIVHESYWDALGRFVGPALYARLIFNPNEQTIVGACDVVITRSNATFAPNEIFEKYRDYQLMGRSYVAYRRTVISQGQHDLNSTEVAGRNIEKRDF